MTFWKERLTTWETEGNRVGKERQRIKRSNSQNAEKNRPREKNG